MLQANCVVLVSAAKAKPTGRTDRWRQCTALLLLLAFSLSSILRCEAFKTSFPFEEVHSEIMTSALAPIGFEPDAIKDVDEGAASQDDIKSWKMFDETHHFDGNNIVGGYNYVRQQIKNSINTAQYCYKDPKELHDARFKLGEAYHALQDFYSHSNWLEICLYDRQKPTVFRWDLHTAFTESNPDGSAQWFTAPLRRMPPELKTGYFTNAEIVAAGADVVERGMQYPIPSSVEKLIPSAAKQLRFKMVEEAARKHPGLRFASEKQYQERIKGTSSFYRALAYAVEDEKKSLLHWEINKDDRQQIEGGMRTPSGETLHDLAKDLAIKDTQLFWKAHVERLLWRQYKGCANLIIPAFKGNTLPELIMNVDLNQRYTPSRTKPLEGSISVRMANMLSRVIHPLGVVVKVYLERTDAPGSTQGHAIEKTLLFKSNEEQKIDLKPLVLVVGQESGRYSLVVNASYECDPTFRPVTKRIDLGGGKLGLVAATATPNPAMEGESIDLKLVYNYAEATRATMHGEGTVESIDGSYRHTLPAQDLPGDGTGWYKPYQATFTYGVPGKYIWYPRVFSDTGEEVKTSVPFEILQSQPKAIHSTALLNKTEGQVGETFILGVNYEITGAPRGPIVATESSSVQYIDGTNTTLEETNANLNSAGVSSVKSQKLWKFQPNTAGVYEWTYDISAPGFGNSRATQTFVVHPAKRLIIDSESITPGSSPNGPTFTLRVPYHLVGLTAQESLQVSEESAISGPARSTFPQTFKTMTFGDSAQILTTNFVAGVPGDYQWTYTIDAGPLGRVVQSLPFKVMASLLPDKPLRDFELVSATVTPPKAPNPAGFQLNVRYRALNLAPMEVVQVEENDYVNFGQKTETHQTSSALAGAGQLLLKSAGFTSTQAGKHVWNYTLTAPGFRTYYGFVPFEVEEAEQRQRLQARLEFSEISCAPGETKNCNILISGYRANTADPVEIVFPQIADGWGTLPGQVQVFPGNESLLPQNMRGAGDFTRVYLAGKGYRARETAPPGLTPIKIIVRQKDAGQVELTLFVKVVKRGETTLGTDKTGGQGGSAGSGQGGSAGSGQGGNAGSGQDGNAGSGQDGNAGSGQGGSAGSGQDGNAGSGQGGSAGSGQDDNAGSGQGGNAGSGQGGSVGSGQGGSVGSGQGGNAGSGQDGNAGSGTGTNKVVYHFKQATISTTAVAGITSTGHSAQADSGPKFSEFTSTSVSVPVAWEESKQGKAGTAQQTARGTVTFTFPDKLFLNSYQTDPTLYTGTASIKCKANATFTRSGPSSAFNSMPVGLFVEDLVAPGVVRSIASLQDSKRNYTSGGASFALSWDASPMVSERAQFSDGEPAHQPRLLLRNPGRTIVGIGGSEVNGFTARVLAPFELEYVAEPGTKTSREETDNTVKSGQIIAKLEKSKIILEAGKLPGVSNNILVQNWKRDTAEPIEVSYPGLGPGNMLPNNIRAVYAGGTQLPDALARLQTDNGIYRWPQSYEALKGANPGTYRIPITVKQKGAAAAYLELEVQIVPSTNAKFGDSTAMFNKNAQTPLAHPPATQIPVSSAQTPLTQVPITQTPRTPTPPVLNLSGRWYGGNGGVIVVQAGNTVVLSTEDKDYATEWRGVMAGNTIKGTWSCPRTNQKGTFTFTYNPNYNQLNMERISGTYYIEDKWGKDPRDFYADRKIGKAPGKSGDTPIQNAKPVNTGWNPTDKPAEHPPVVVVIDDPKVATKPVNTGWNPTGKPAEHPPVVIDDPKVATKPVNTGWNPTGKPAEHPPVVVVIDDPKVATKPVNTGWNPTGKPAEHSPVVIDDPKVATKPVNTGWNPTGKPAEHSPVVIDDPEVATKPVNTGWNPTDKPAEHPPVVIDDPKPATNPANPGWNPHVKAHEPPVRIQANAPSTASTPAIASIPSANQTIVPSSVGQATQVYSTPTPKSAFPPAAASPSVVPQPAKTGTSGNLTGTVWKVTCRYESGTTEDVHIKLVSGAVGQTMLAAPLTDKNLTQMMGTYDGRTASLRATFYGIKHLMNVEFSSDHRSGTGRSHYVLGDKQGVLGLTLTRIR